jgi:coniferyl-aldehyde dehydrogenase
VATPNPNDDTAAIAMLHDRFIAQKQAFLRDPYPSANIRKINLEVVMGMMMTYGDRIVAAMSADFGSHPEPASRMVEVLGAVGRAAHAIAHLDTWLAPEARDVDTSFFGSATASIRHQPKGVIGNIVPWNFPFDLGIGPLVDMLAAGNRAIIKPSEYTPACAALMAEMIAANFDPDLVTVVQGGLDLAHAFTDLRWDHLLYTGSPAVGRQVMMAAARNLVPVTLELGGKCPALLAPGAVTEATVADVIGTKLIKNGQMCISVDYVLIQRDELDTFVSRATDYVRQAVPNYSHSADCTGIVSDRHLDRILGMIEETRAAGVRVVEPEPDGMVDRDTRRMPLSIVVDPPADLAVMREEIFGPILPVVPYDTLEDAIGFINAGERPLGLYVFGDDAATTKVGAQTISGGLAINCCAMQGALHTLGFGGIGNSGMGRHHGIEGFREFSNPRGVFVRGEGDVIAAFHPPYATAAAMLTAMG